MITRSGIQSLLTLATLLALAAGLVLGYEQWHVTQLPAAQAEAEYHFGAEAMIAHGGAKYRSRDDYLAAGSPVLVATWLVVVAGLIGLRHLNRQDR